MAEAPVPAVAVPATVAALPRRRPRGWLVAVVLGLVALLAVGIAAAVFSAQEDELYRSGVRTSGTVYELYPDSRGSAGRADVRFLVDGKPTFGTVELGSDVDEYERDQPVTVRYDPDDPQRLMIDDVGYQPVGSETPMAIGLIGGLFAVGGGLVTRWGGRRSHARLPQVLAAGPWAPVHMRVTRPGGRSVFTLDDGSIWSSSDGWPRYDAEPRRLAGWGLPDEDPAIVAPGQDAWCVVAGDDAVFSPDQGAPLVLAHRSGAVAAAVAEEGAPAAVAPAAVAPVAPPTRRVLLGRWGTFGVVVLAAAVAGAFGLAWIGVGLEPRAPLAELLNPTLPLAFIVAFFSLMATCRVTGDPAGFVEIAGLLLVRRVPVAAIAAVSAGSGLRITLTSGRTVGSAAHGESLLGDMLGYPRSVRAAAAIDAFRRSVPGSADDRADDSTDDGAEVVTDLRVRGLLGAALLGVLLVTGAVLLNWR